MALASGIVGEVRTASVVGFLSLRYQPVEPRIVELNGAAYIPHPLLSKYIFS